MRSLRAESLTSSSVLLAQGMTFAALQSAVRLAQHALHRPQTATWVAVRCAKRGQ